MVFEVATQVDFQVVAVVEVEVELFVEVQKEEAFVEEEDPVQVAVNAFLSKHRQWWQR